MQIQNKTISFLVAVTMVSCASGPQVVVDPKSVTDGIKYNKDMAECKTIADNYDASSATTGSALLGAGAAVGTAALVLATGGLYLLPAGILAAGGGGAAIGGGISKSKESESRERIWADCLNDRGYKAYTSK
jgi:hypothetical protein